MQATQGCGSAARATAVAKRETSWFGRIVVFSAFGAVVLYFTVALFGSILANLYGEPPSAHAGVLRLSERNWCIRALVGLRDELEGQVTLELQHPRREGAPLSRWHLWDAGWRLKLATARSRCEGSGNDAMDQAFAMVSELHDGYDATVNGVTTARTGPAEGLRQALQELKQQH